MYREICLFAIAPFYVEYGNKDDDYFNFIIAEYDTERGKFGFKPLSNREKSRTIKDFCNKYGLAIKFHSRIAIEIHKAGRTLRWVHKALTSAGYDIHYNSLSRKINGTKPLDSTLKSLIYKILNIYE